jgi:serine/threonine protein kinase/Tol biopolymer transport system component
VSLAVGARLGAFEILSRLGGGGMGEVYRARDTRLDRTVAIKILPEHLGQHPDLRQRFEREARALSSLSDSHICALYDIGHQDGTDYLVLEYIEGESLHDRLGKGPLPLEQALRYGSEIADALGRAHRSGIIHRDLKPGNVMLAKAGAKLLDFGLARVARPIVSGNGDLSDVATPSEPLTGAGTLVGTIPYMAPEQVEGREADPRTDIWALGCLLYEMVTGQRAFMATSPATVLGAILRDEPRPMRELAPLTPPSLERLVKRCLDKDPEERWQSAHDVAAELRWIGEHREDAVRTVGRGSRALSLALAGSAGAFLAAGLVWLILGRGSDRRVEELHVAEAVRFTHEMGLFESPTWSPDGKLVAFASNRSGNFEIYVRRADGGQEVNVTDHPAEDVQPALSPDGRSIAFISTRSSRTGLVSVGELGLEYRVYGGDLWTTPALGGSARRLASDANYPAWRPDGGAILYVSGPEDRRSLREIAPDGSSSREVLSSKDSRWEIMNPSYSQDGLWISFGDGGSTLLLMPARGGTPHALFTTATTSHAWADDGSLFFLKRGASGGTTIGRVGIDPRSGRVARSEDVVAVLTGALRDIAVAPGSHGLAVSAIEAGFDLARLPLSPDGRPEGPEDVLSGGYIRNRYPAYSFDGRRLAYSSNVTGRLEVWVLDLQTLRPERLPTPEGLETYMPAWLPDGKTLLVMGSRIGGPRSLWLLSLDGSRADELRWAGEAASALGSIGVSPDGRRVLVELVDGPEGQLYELDLVGRSKRRLTSAPGNTYDGIWSRDGRQIAYIASTAGTLQLWTQPAQGGEARQLTFGRERMRHPSFSPDGRWIYVQPSHRNIWRVPTAGGTPEPVTRFPESGLFLEEPALSPDGRTLAYARWKGGSSLWLLSLGGHPHAASRERP